MHCTLSRKVPKESELVADIRNPLEAKMKQAYSICDAPTHRRNHRDASSVAMSDHFLRCSLSGHQHTSDVDLEHSVRILGRVLQSGHLLLNAGRCNQTIEPTMRLRDAANDTVQLRHISHIDLSVV